MTKAEQEHQHLMSYVEQFRALSEQFEAFRERLTVRYESVANNVAEQAWWPEVTIVDLGFPGRRFAIDIAPFRLLCVFGVTRNDLGDGALDLRGTLTTYAESFVPEEKPQALGHLTFNEQGYARIAAPSGGAFEDTHLSTELKKVFTLLLNRSFEALTKLP